MEKWTDDEEKQINMAVEVRRRAAKLTRADAACEGGTHRDIANGKCGHCGKEAAVPPPPDKRKKGGIGALLN